MTESEVTVPGTPRSTRDRVTAIVTVPAWYAMLYLGFVGWVAWQTRRGADGWEDLVMFAAIAYGALASVLGSTIGIVIVAVRIRSAGWRANPVVSGTGAAAVGLVGWVLVPLIVRLLDLLQRT
ncbi:hypothetical protein E1193_10365 [Micromonospora sp. KC606]|uniref:hypothetical protein n=1 Tax=Micromonospora sp. KC606 TaxID=2530379 RepID=UPI0010525011|nr:hypothetical protein [Micromonospora sp. KC606]TDC82860.1 hypothetical protein E1193_10365 [Micromonospora sp. KC606]